jgi:predicted DNA-binding protein with PD1-like motif
VIEIKDAELMSALEARLSELQVESGVVVSLIGAVDSFTLSTMPEDDPSSDVVTAYSVPAEMHGSGEVVEGRPHLHATMAVAGEKSLAGHLHKAYVGHWFARVYVVEL